LVPAGGELIKAAVAGN